MLYQIDISRRTTKVTEFFATLADALTFIQRQRRFGREDGFRIASGQRTAWYGWPAQWRIVHKAGCFAKGA